MAVSESWQTLYLKKNIHSIYKTYTIWKINSSLSKVYFPDYKVNKALKSGPNSIKIAKFKIIFQDSFYILHINIKKRRDSKDFRTEEGEKTEEGKKVEGVRKNERICKILKSVETLELIVWYSNIQFHK